MIGFKFLVLGFITLICRKTRQDIKLRNIIFKGKHRMHNFGCYIVTIHVIIRILLNVTDTSNGLKDLDYHLLLHLHKFANGKY